MNKNKFVTIITIITITLAILFLSGCNFKDRLKADYTLYRAALSVDVETVKPEILRDAIRGFQKTHKIDMTAIEAVETIKEEINNGK
jgi:hypothetical protein